MASAQAEACLLGLSGNPKEPCLGTAEPARRQGSRLSPTPANRNQALRKPTVTIPAPAQKQNTCPLQRMWEIKVSHARPPPGRSIISKLTFRIPPSVFCA